MFHSVYPTSMTRARRDASGAFWVPEPVRVVKVSFSYGFMGDLEEVLQAHPVIHRSIQLPQPKMSKDKPLQQSLLVHSDGLYGPYCSVVCLRSLEDVDGLVGERLLVAFDVTTCEKLEMCDTDTVTLSVSFPPSSRLEHFGKIEQLSLPSVRRDTAMCPTKLK